MPRVTAMLLVRNEGSRYLSRILNNLSSWVDQIVVLDDASQDRTWEVCFRHAGVRLLASLPESLFVRNESAARRLLWDLATRDRPDWLAAFDADELLEERGTKEIRPLLDQDLFNAIELRLFDLWGSEEQYRVDGGWNPWGRFVRFLVRYDPRRPPDWPELPVHCGRWPLAYRRNLVAYQADLRVQHLGWVDPAGHQTKYAYYASKDRELYGKVTPHTASILAPPESIKLEKWGRCACLS